MEEDLKKQASGFVDETNFRETAQKAIQGYFDRDAILDAIFWANIIKLYEAELSKKRA